MNPYTPESLARRWDCSPRHVRNLINRGELRAFRVGGKLIRIRVNVVEEFETCGGLEGIVENGVLSAAPAQSVADIRSLRTVAKLSGSFTG